MDPVDEAEETLSKQNSVFLRSISSEEDLLEKNGLEKEQVDAEDKTSEQSDSTENEDSTALKTPQLGLSSSLRGELTNLSIPDRDDLVESLKFENQAIDSITNILRREIPDSEHDGLVSEQDLSDEEDEETKESIPKESILKRINSHKGMNSYQLGKQLSCKWTTGAGPRIGCVRDYPSKLQFRALEKVNLSPRNASNFRSQSSRESFPNSFSGEIHIKKNSFSGELPHFRNCTPQSSPLCKGTSKTGAPKWS